MAQIKALTPEGKLPTTAIAHVEEIAGEGAHPVDSPDAWVFAETDENDKISRAVDAQGRTWLSLHPDSQGVMPPAIADQFSEVDSNVWQWTVTDAGGRVALGVRTDGTVYPDKATSADPFDVIVMVGQSNAQGAGRPVIDTEVWPNIWQYPAASKAQTGIIPAVDNLQHQGPIVGPTGHGPAIFFAREYALQHPGRNVLLVPAAYSGTGFSTSAPTNGGTWDWTKPDDGTNLAWNALRQTQAALAAAGPGARLAGILWHQGEGDVGIAAEYAGYLDGFIAWLRTELDAPDVPFVAGMLAYEVAHLSANYETITRAHFGVQTRNEHTGFARSVQAMSNPGDRTHFSARGQMRMGKAFYDAWCRARYNYDLSVAPNGVENPSARRVGDEIRVAWDESWSRVEDYVVEWSTDGITWSTVGVTKFAPLDCEATLPAPAGVTQIRITATNTHGSSWPFTIDV